ncbi:OmpP1/FadL family transporter [Salinarimonas sp.]|uniref:OmpP1/FadL family transporter n=1 Tax=Salinarimonas sp. TaxID=2766526 RepID=UPI003919577A
MPRNTKAFAFAAVSMIALGVAGAAQASSFAIRAGQSTQGLGLSFAGAASGGIGLGAMAWNPATITMFPGRQSQLNVTYILPYAAYRGDAQAQVRAAQVSALLGRPVSPDTGNIGGSGALVPASYTAWQLTPNLSVGWTTGAPWGLSSKPENQDFVGQIYGRSSTIRTINVSPTVGYRVNDWFSVGAALQVQYFTTDLKQAYPFPFGIPGVSPDPRAPLGPFAPGAPSTIIKGDDIGFGFRLGATLRPWEGATIGLGYRSEIRHDLRGTFSTPGVLPTPDGGFITAGDYPIRASLRLPQSVTFGYTQVINDRWTAHFGAEWTDWSVFSRFPLVRRDNGQVITSLNFDYRDSWFVAAGAEYRWDDRLTLRGGIAYEWSAVSDRVRTVRISDNDRLWLSIGAGYQITEQLRLDASYAHLFVKKAPVAIAAGNPSFNPALPVEYRATARPNVNIFSVSLTYRWDRPTAAAQPVPGIFKN